MPIVNRVAALSDEMAAWRHDFHENPELQYDVHRTAGIVADRLREFGCDEVVTGIGRTGVVGVIRGAQVRLGQDHWPARRHGCAADHGDVGRTLCLQGPRQDARLRP
ncbi:hypothetical protein ACVWXL_004313 [Bradyrhizobium sp. GM22.5]